MEAKDASKLKTYADETGTGAVHLKVDLNLQHPDNHVEVELWFSTLVDFPDTLLEGMYDYHNLLGNDVSFEPRIATFACEDCPQDIKERDCLSNGKYCPFVPTRNGFPGEPMGSNGEYMMDYTKWQFEGRKVLMAALTYKC